MRRSVRQLARFITVSLSGFKLNSHLDYLVLKSKLAEQKVNKITC